MDYSMVTYTVEYTESQNGLNMRMFCKKQRQTVIQAIGSDTQKKVEDVSIIDACYFNHLLVEDDH